MKKNTKDERIQPYMDLDQLGTTGLIFYGERVYEEIEKKLQGANGLKEYRKMVDNDPIVAALIFSITMMLRQVEWDVEPASKKAKDRDHAEFVKGCLDDMETTWAEHLNEICTYLQYGFSLHEIVYKKRKGEKLNDPALSSRYNDGKIGWSKIPIRDQISIEQGGWVFGNNGEILGAHQITYHGEKKDVYIPMSKALLFRTTSAKNNPQGRSILRSSWRPYYFKRQIENLEAITIERDGAGLPVIYCPPELFSPNASSAQKAMLERLKRVARGIRIDEQAGLVMPMAYDANGKELYKIELLSAQGKKNNDTSKVIQRYSAEIAMSTLADFILLGHTERGTQALAREKSDLFLTAIQSWLDVIADQFNKNAIPRLMQLNGWDVSSSPKLVYGDISKRDATALINNIRNLSSSGMELFPDPDLENHVRAKLSMPLLDKEQVDYRKNQMQNAEKVVVNSDPDKLAAQGLTPDGQPVNPKNEVSTEVVGNPKSSPKKRRGRPPKVQDVYSDVSDS